MRSDRSQHSGHVDGLVSWTLCYTVSGRVCVGLVDTHLTFICAVVPLLYIFDLERPVVAALCVQDLEALVVRVGQHARAQDVPVTPTHPRYVLEQRNEIRNSSAGMALEELARNDPYIHFT